MKVFASWGPESQLTLLHVQVVVFAAFVIILVVVVVLSGSSRAFAIRFACNTPPSALHFLCVVIPVAG